MRVTRRFDEIKESITLALDVLRRNPLRSFLTVLGIMIGVTTIIVIGAVVNGLNSNVLGQIQTLGSTTIIVSRMSWATFGRPSMELLQRRYIQAEWADGLAQLPHIVAATPAAQIANYEVGAGSSEVRRGNYRSKNVILTGDGPDVVEINSFDMERGRFFNATDSEHHSPVVVLGHTTANTLFPNGEDPIGQEVLLEGHAFTVIGVLEEQKQALGTGDNAQDNMVCLPFAVLKKLHPEFKDVILLAKASSTDDLPIAVDEVREYMRRMRKLPSDKKDDSEIMTTDTFVQTWNEISNGIFIVMIAVGSVALLVGGIGVMNIMLVSVTERTREIGVRKAIGARRSDITWQFLLEAMTLTGAGGVLGILAGCTLSFLIRTLVPALPSTVPLWSEIAGFIVSVSIGLFFGLWPAVKASRLDPIVALRYE